jgi:hypothetical protein
MTFSLKTLLKDLKTIQNLFKKEQKNNNFGNIHDKFIYTGPYLKHYREGTSGFFYELDFAKGSPFDVPTPHPDLHLSIIDARGFAVPHTTFKPEGNNGIEFHYGYRTSESMYEGFWIKNPQNKIMEEGPVCEIT